MLTAGKALPAVYGASSPKMNAADLRTKGYELQLVWRDGFNLAGKPFNYSVTASFSDYLTTITKYDNPNRSLAQDYYVGMRWGEIWGYYTDGLFKDDAEAASWPIDQKYVNNGINGSAGSELSKSLERVEAACLSTRLNGYGALLHGDAVLQVCNGHFANFCYLHCSIPLYYST